MSPSARPQTTRSIDIASNGSARRSARAMRVVCLTSALEHRRRQVHADRSRTAIAELPQVAAAAAAGVEHGLPAHIRQQREHGLVLDLHQRVVRPRRIRCSPTVRTPTADRDAQRLRSPRSARRPVVKRPIDMTHEHVHQSARIPSSPAADTGTRVAAGSTPPAACRPSRGTATPMRRAAAADAPGSCACR